MKVAIFSALIFSTIFLSISTMPTASEPAAAATAPVATPSPTTMPAPVLIPTTPIASPEQASAVAAPTPTPAAAAIPITSTPAPSTPESTVTAAPDLSAFEKEIGEVSKDFAEISTLKEELKTKLDKLDDKLQDSRVKAAQAKKIGIEVLQKDKASTQAENEQINSILQNVKTTQEYAQKEFFQQFENSIKKIDDLMKKVQDKINALQIKGLKLQLVKATKEAPVAGPGEAAPTEQKPEAEKTAEKTWLDKASDWLADKTAKLIGFMRKTFNSIKNWAYSSDQSTDEVKKNFKSDNVGPQSIQD
ncbi:MAG: hypothetical protein V1855_03385, partial [bacterium]